MQEDVAKIQLAADAAVLQGAQPTTGQGDPTNTDQPPIVVTNPEDQPVDEQASKKADIPKSNIEVDQPIQETDISKGKASIEQTAEETDNAESETGTGKKVTPQSSGDVNAGTAILSHELLYGTGKQGIALKWPALYGKIDEEIKTALAKSEADKIIKGYNDEEVASFLQLIHASTVANALQTGDENQTTPLGEILTVALPEKAHQEALISAYRDFKNQSSQNENIDYGKFWSEYLPRVKEFQENPELISKVLYTQQLSILSGNHLPLMTVLQQDPQTSSVKQLVALQDDQWKTIIAKAGVPEFVKGATEEERMNAYADQMQSFLYAAYPTQKIAVMLDRQELPIKDENVVTGIKAFLANNEAFDFSSSKIDEFQDKIAEAAGEDHADGVQTELKRMQRVFQVSPTHPTMGVLMGKDLNSAYTISSIPKKSFMKMHSADLGGDVLADAVYQRAGHISTMMSERAMQFQELAYSHAPALAYSSADQQAAITVLQNNFPNYSNLFGSPDICECEECRSVYSAAAYFVDLLRFLWRGVKNADKSSPDFPDGKSPLDMFAARRPDLLNLPLTCENTNTIIPYIDLVNEVMEYYTCHGNNNTAYDTGKTTADELRANPQYFELEAYRILKDAVYPFSLPYHQPLDVIRTYGDHLKTERYEVMKGMQKISLVPAINTTTNKAIEAEVLRMSKEEYRVLTLTDFNGGPDLDELNTASLKPTGNCNNISVSPFQTRQLLQVIQPL